jgi:hypothetical protein
MPRHVLAIALAAALVIAPAFAERPPQKKSDAELVFEGTVEAVERTPEENVDYYLVTIKATKIHKGDVLTAGKVYKVHGWRVTKFKPGTAGAAGHLAFPQKGDRIKAYANKYESRGGFEALYPDWFDTLEKGTPVKK